jgi:hypothetical protein
MENRSLQMPHYFGAAEKRIKTAGAKWMRGRTMSSAQERCETSANLRIADKFGEKEN